ncbi:MAG: YaiI/YqxD family protein [Stappiaceae bacterium]
MTEIYVDADACPVKSEVIRVAERHRLRVHIVSNSWMRLDESDFVNRVVVSEGSDVADDWIAERAATGDIVITSDIPLADRCIKRGADVLGPTGKPFTEDSIGMAMAMRELNAELRDTGVIRGYNAAFGPRDRSNFLNVLENTVRKALKAG